MIKSAVFTLIINRIQRMIWRKRTERTRGGRVMLEKLSRKVMRFEASK